MNHYIKSELYHPAEISDLEALLQLLQREVDSRNLKLLEQEGDRNNLKLMQQEVALWQDTISKIVQILPDSPLQPDLEDAPSGRKVETTLAKNKH